MYILNHGIVVLARCIHDNELGRRFCDLFVLRLLKAGTVRYFRELIFELRNYTVVIWREHLLIGYFQLWAVA